ncbi:uncharacterized protein LOC117340796 [Pecten maximus]|uniref:uncharacterized protein LOC117340796 n=1 Tax=Pecten maximus TaxID=6579 RepID=UPI0014589350|nr:uncharacterized protein LOC117340796 [Pecten maximus]
MENGCTKNKEILTGFHKHATQPIVEASIQGFHMLYSKTVFIKCVVKICRSSQCEIKPPNFDETSCNNYGFMNSNNSVPDTSNTQSYLPVVKSFTVKMTTMEYFSSSFAVPTTTLYLWLTVLAIYISYHP